MGVERAFAADGGDADAVAVVSDPGHGLAEVPVRFSEAETVEQRHRPCAHRHDVAEDAADAGRGALERLDGGWVVVRVSDLERDGEAAAQVDHAGIAARPLQHPVAGGGRPEQGSGVLVAAVFRPERRTPPARSRSARVRAAPRYARSRRRSTPRLRCSGCGDGAQGASVSGASDADGKCLRATAVASHSSPATNVEGEEWLARRASTGGTCRASLALADLGELVHVHQGGRRATCDPATLVLGRSGSRRSRLRFSCVAFGPATGGGRRGSASTGGRSSSSASSTRLCRSGCCRGGETRIDSGTASIIQASVPIFTVLLAFGFFHEQRVTGSRLVGVGVGFLGVALLVGARPGGKILGALAVVGMAVCYAAGGLLVRRYLSAARPPIVALGTSAVAAIAVLPAGVARAPSYTPDWKTIGSVVFLGIVGTAFAYLLFFTIIAGTRGPRTPRSSPTSCRRLRSRTARFSSGRVSEERPPPGSFSSSAASRSAPGSPAALDVRRPRFPSPPSPARPPNRRDCASPCHARRRRLAGRALHLGRRRALPLRSEDTRSRDDRGRGRALAAGARRVRADADRRGRRVCRSSRLQRGQRAAPNRPPRGSCGPSPISWPPNRRRGLAACSALSPRRARLPPYRAGVLRVQRARDRPGERAGFVREGVKRKAYLRHGEWQDAVLFSLLAEELEPVAD